MVKSCLENNHVMDIMENIMPKIVLSINIRSVLIFEQKSGQW
jgi:hypothetical protein